jgi:hypothetical protein
MSLFSKVAGVVGSLFQIGGPNGPGINSNTGSVEAVAAGGATYTNFRALISEYQQNVPAAASVTVPTGSTILVAQDFANNGHIALQGTARLVWVY